MSKKWKIALGVLAVIVIFCLWYTRPRSMGELVGGGKITSVSLAAQTVNFEGAPVHFDVWQIDSHEDREYVNGELEELLRSCKYRVALRSLLPFPDSFSIPGDKGAPMIHFAAVMEDGSSFIAIYKGAAVTLSLDLDGRTLVAQAEDKEIAEKLLAYAQEYGWAT